MKNRKEGLFCVFTDDKIKILGKGLVKKLRNLMSFGVD